MSKQNYQFHANSFWVGNKEQKSRGTLGKPIPTSHMKKNHTANVLYRLDIVKAKNTQQVEYNQLTLPLQTLFAKREKSQILSVPGISPKRRDRYRVVIGEQILGDKLTLDEALRLAKPEGKSAPQLKRTTTNK